MTATSTPSPQLSRNCGSLDARAGEPASGAVILLITPARGTEIVPGVWEMGIVPTHVQQVHSLKGVLPYMTFAPDAVLTEQELLSLPQQWEKDEAE